MRRPEVDTATHMATRLCAFCLHAAWQRAFVPSALLNLCVAFFFRFHINCILFTLLPTFSFLDRQNFVRTIELKTLI